MENMSHATYSPESIEMVYDMYEPKEPSGDPPIIVLHGFGFNKNLYRAVSSLLCDETGRTVYVPDLRGHGDSLYKKKLSYELYVEDLKRFVIEKNISKFCLVAHSMGTRVASLLQEKSPNFIEKLVFIDYLPLSDGSLLKAEKTMLVSDILAESQTFLSTLGSWLPYDTILSLARKRANNYYKSDKWSSMVPMLMRKDAVNGFSVCCDIENLKQFVESHSLMNMDHSATYDTQVLVVSAEDSMFCADDLKEIHLRHFPNTKFCVLENCTHNLVMEDPEGFVVKVKPFLQYGLEFDETAAQEPNGHETNNNSTVDM